MPSLTDVVSGAGALASDVQQIIDAWKGTAGKGVPAALTAVNDPVNFALAVKNNDAGASKAFVVYNSAGAVLLQADKNGVIASADGIAGASQIPTLTAVQTFTNKTLTAPTITTPVINGAIAGTTFGAWTTITPTLTFAQSGAVAVTVTYASYIILGKLAIVQIAMTVGAVGTIANDLSIEGLPAILQPKHVGSSITAGVGVYQRNGAPYYNVTVIATANTTLKFMSSGSTGYLGNNPSFAAANGDLLSCNLMYELA